MNSVCRNQGVPNPKRLSTDDSVTRILREGATHTGLLRLRSYANHIAQFNYRFRGGPQTGGIDAVIIRHENQILHRPPASILSGLRESQTLDPHALQPGPRDASA